jgi:hypothetical protein
MDVVFLPVHAYQVDTVADKDEDTPTWKQVIFPSSTSHRQRNVDVIDPMRGQYFLSQGPRLISTRVSNFLSILNIEIEHRYNRFN